MGKFKTKGSVLIDERVVDFDPSICVDSDFALKVRILTLHRHACTQSICDIRGGVFVCINGQVCYYLHVRVTIAMVALISSKPSSDFVSSLSDDAW